MDDGKLLFTRHNERLLALLIKDERLLSVKVYEEDRTSLVGNIYIGRVQNILTNVDAAFVEISGNQVAFLPLQDAKAPHIIRPIARENIKQGDEVLVQVTRDAVKTKQPVLTTKLSLAGSYLAISDERAPLGISQKITGKTRKRIETYLEEEGFLSADKNHESFHMVVRTNAGMLSDLSPIRDEWERLSNELTRILKEAEHRTCFTCLYQNENPYLTDLKSYYTEDFSEIVTDCREVYEALTAYYKRVSFGVPIPALRFYEDGYPLSKLYQIESRLQAALHRRVWLRSGAYLVIEPTEALTVIDVNSGKNEKGKSGEEAALAINREAAKEIALQLRLRNLSGIIIVDFISMELHANNESILQEMRTLVKQDPVKTKVVDMTPLGLLEITRKRVSKPLHELLSSS